MFEDNLESRQQIKYNMINDRNKINQFQIQDILGNYTQRIEQNNKEIIARNILINLGNTQNILPLKIRQQRNNINGWIESNKDNNKILKSFRTKTISQNKRRNINLMMTLQSSVQLENSQIPKLKNILKKLQSPKNSCQFSNFKQNIIYSDKKIINHDDNLISTIPYKFESIFNTISSRKNSIDKKKKIITYSQYKQNTIKKSFISDIIDSSQKGKIKNILVIKQAGKKINMRR